jgi:hypothetical protein
VFHSSLLCAFIFLFGGLTLLGTTSILSGSVQALLFVTTMVTMLLTAKLFAKREKKTERGQSGLPPIPMQRLEEAASLPLSAK